MALTRWDALESPLPFRDVFDRLLDSSFFGMTPFGITAHRLPMDVFETEHQYVIEAVLPGVKPEEIQLTAKGGLLTIQTAVHEGPKDTEGGTVIRRERFTGVMTRTIELPSEVDVDKVKAVYEDGVLTLRVPKVEAAIAKQIPVETKKS
jgi:HSP20 family protein